MERRENRRIERGVVDRLQLDDSALFVYLTVINSLAVKYVLLFGRVKNVCNIQQELKYLRGLLNVKIMVDSSI